MLPLHFHEGVGGHCSLSAVSAFSVTHSSLQKTNSPNESSCAVAVPGVSYSAPMSSPKPFAGSVLKGVGSRMSPPSLAAPTITPSRCSFTGGRFMGALCKPCAEPQGLLHPLLCLHHSKGSEMMLCGFTPRAVLCQGPR